MCFIVITVYQKVKIVEDNKTKLLFQNRSIFASEPASKRSTISRRNFPPKLDGRRHPGRR
jgi:hypothetical protein